MSNHASRLIKAADNLRLALRSLTFSPPVDRVYNPLDYAWEPHTQWIRKFGNSPKKLLLLGMNPGPFGMAQTGVPFGEVAAVRDWMGISAPVSKPPHEHPKRPIDGFNCKRSEVSGRRLWGWARDSFGSADRFFSHHFAVNFCPLIFLEDSGRNRTPDKIPAPEIAPVEAACRLHLAEVIRILQPDWLIGVGNFAAAQLATVITPESTARIVRIPHPSPANPAANRDWSGAASLALAAAGVPCPDLLP
jgi:single-strand selective monofunctional uracil DNA glycosylase